MIKNAFDVLNVDSVFVKKKWLILGKGPSFSLLRKEHFNDFQICTLNDTIREVDSATIAHFIDFEAFLRCKTYLNRSQYVVLPWFPHFKNKPGHFSLEELTREETVLKTLLEEGRLLWYDLSTSSIRHGSYPIVRATYFSAEAALNMLAISGVKYVRSLGVDGGTSYSARFSDLSRETHLSNGQKNFEKQFLSFAEIISRTGVDYGPLNMELPVKVFVGATKSEMLAVRVLEYSIKKNSSVSVEVKALCDTNIIIPTPKDIKNQSRTPFSFQRFIIPQVCNYQGKAIYLDADMLVFKDIKGLWERTFDGANILSSYTNEFSGRKPQYSVMLMDCNKLNWNIKELVDKLDSNILTYEELMYDFSLANTSTCIEPKWNSLEFYSENDTALLHYTDMNTQPWVSSNNPLGYLWVKALRNAIEDGAITRTFVEEEVNYGHVRPSLLYQLDYKLDDPILLPKSVLMADKDFKAPYKSLLKHNASPWKNKLLWLKAKLRTVYQDTVFYNFQIRVKNRIASYSTKGNLS